MKKFLILTIAVLTAFLMASCSSTALKEEDKNVQNETQSFDESDKKSPVEKEEAENDEKDEIKENENTENSELSETNKKPSSSQKPQSSENSATASKPSTSTKPEQDAHAESTKQEAEAAPEEDSAKQDEPQQSTPETNGEETVAASLLKQFKNIASSSNSLAIAEELLKNPVIAFSGAAASVEEGYLMGFDNEISGFSEGAMFSPMIGTIPFVGYVFTLESNADTSQFISTLKNSANLRWNICTEAEEMVSGAVENKVFFVMSPKTFEE